MNVSIKELDSMGEWEKKTRQFERIEDACVLIGRSDLALKTQWMEKGYHETLEYDELKIMHIAIEMQGVL